MLALNVFLLITTLIIMVLLVYNEFYSGDNTSFGVLTMLNLSMFTVAFLVIVGKNKFSLSIIMLMFLELIILIASSFLYDIYLSGNKSVFIIIQYFTIISLIMVARLNVLLAYKQMLILVISIVGFLIVVKFYDKLHKYRNISIILMVVFISFLLLTNSTMYGSRNWIKIFGVFSIQPSEFTKIVYCLFLASLFSIFKHERGKKLIISGIVTAIICGILVLQNDFGTALIFYSLFIIMGYVITTNRNIFIAGSLFTAFVGVIVFTYVGHIRGRIEVWINPYKYAETTGYQIIKGIEAFKSGGLLGKGFFNGEPQKIPVVVSDYIIAGIGEELGVTMVILIIMMFLLMSVIIISKSFQLSDNFDFYLINSILIAIMFQSFVILGGVSKLIPLTGVTLPFISYGGSSLLSSYLGFAFIARISREKKTLERKKKRNKPMRRVRALFATISLALILNLLYIVYIF